MSLASEGPGYTTLVACEGLEVWPGRCVAALLLCTARTRVLWKASRTVSLTLWQCHKCNAVYSRELIAQSTETGRDLWNCRTVGSVRRPLLLLPSRSNCPCQSGCCRYMDLTTVLPVLNEIWTLRCVRNLMRALILEPVEPVESIN
jgi:hypothetical protein